jgi:putative transposase
MPSRVIPILANVVYHVTNRARVGLTLFDSPRAYGAFVDLIAEVHVAQPVRILAFNVMPNHWHFVLWPETDDGVEDFIGPLSLTHAKRFHRIRGTTGSGPIYPKRFEARPIESDQGLHRAIRYVERNPCAAGFVPTPAAWPWSSASPDSRIRLAEWPIPRPANWGDYVAQMIEPAELLQIRRALKGEPPQRRRRLRRTDGFEW